MEGFLQRVTTPDWVDRLTESAPAGGLAGNLLALANTLGPAHRSCFLREALGRRVTRELSQRGERDAESWAQALSLLGASSAIGLSGPVPQARWPDAKDLAEVLERRAPDPDRTTIGHLQVQFWLGLHEMARWRADSVVVSPRLAGRILALWQATEQDEIGQNLPPHVRARNAEMVAWLLQCKAAGWRLVPPETQSSATNPAGQT